MCKSKFMAEIDSKISSEHLADLIIHALKTSGLVSEDSYSEAVEIAKEEINARKGVKDYWCSECPNLNS
jgi:hypothetical protein